MPKAIKEACKFELWCQTKMTDFLKMRQNLGEPKTSTTFEEIEEDAILRYYWNKGHPFVVYQFGTCSDSNSQRQNDHNSNEDIQGTEDLRSTKHIVNL